MTHINSIRIILDGDAVDQIRAHQCFRCCKNARPGVLFTPLRLA